ncbi:MAG: DNA-3-methyladenine glycosylase [Acholeplasmataceae bacterium]|jgi:DNA-3-methyladenine glycosylase II|nr:DNA-3-methyladenine glycosylase [Acholeplasmataceae bacterium]
MKTIVYQHESEITKYLIERDPKLSELFDKQKQVTVYVSDNYYESLIDTIIAQQLSGKAAATISKRVHTFFNEDITPENLIKADDESLRALGVSYPKIKYLKSLAEHMIDQSVDFSQLDNMSNQEVIDMLIQIKGIGVWSAQMFLMFSLGREDVFSPLDLGLRNAVKHLYQNPDLTVPEIEKISENWSPYRSVVSHFLWHIWDAK